MSPCPPSALPYLHFTTTSSIRPLSVAEREAILGRTACRAAHDLIFESHIDLFDRVEIGPPPPGLDDAGSPSTITFWNVERGRHPKEQAALLAAQDAAAHLLCELDLGMARTEQRHTTADLAERLGCTYAYGVEFLELGLGDRREQQAFAGQTNAAGLHGAAILSSRSLGRPALVRLRQDGAWFDGKRGECRVGSRIAVLATMVIGSRLVTLATVHLESHGDPISRAEETTMLLHAIDAYAADQPVLIGGDFNTSTLDRAEVPWPVIDDERAMNPIAYEPLFDHMREHGYSWQAANDMNTPTQRRHSEDGSTAPLGKIDWFFTRGLDVLTAKTVPAVDARGRPLADHEMLVVTIRPEEEA